MKVKKFLKDEKGASMPLVVIILGLFALGFIALIIDAGTLFVERKKMITAADAAALAGAQVLREYKVANLPLADAITKAEETAKQYAIQNGADPELIQVYAGEKSITLPDGKSEARQITEVTVGKKQSLIFARFLGDDIANVKAHALATWGYVHKSYIGSFIPLFTFDCNYKLDTDVYLHEKIEDTNGYGYVDIGGGMGSIKQAIAGDFVGGSYIYNNYLDGKAGNGESLLGAVEERMIDAQKQPTAEERKRYMTGLVPIIDKAEFYRINSGKLNQSSSQWQLPIKYFAYYEIRDVIKQKTITGSAEALDYTSTEYKQVITRFNYTNKLAENLLTRQGEAENVVVLGRFTGKIIEARTIAELGDQLNPNPGGDEPAMYTKLIK